MFPLKYWDYSLSLLLQSATRGSYVQSLKKIQKGTYLAEINF